MSLQNANKFIDLLLSDKTMQERTAGMKPEEVLAFAREQGLECTLEELKEETLKSRELSPDEMDQAAGGSAAAYHYSKEKCPKSPDPDHQHKWVKTGNTSQKPSCFWSTGTYSIPVSTAWRQGGRAIPAGRGNGLCRTMRQGRETRDDLRSRSHKSDSFGCPVFIFPPDRIRFAEHQKPSRSSQSAERAGPSLVRPPKYKLAGFFRK